MISCRVFFSCFYCRNVYRNELVLQPPGNLLKALWKVDQTSSEPCYKALFSHIQAYSENCATLAYAETWYTRNPGIFRRAIFRILLYLWKFTNIQNLDIFETHHIFRTPPKIKFFAKKLKTIIIFPKYSILYLLTGLWIRLSLSKYSLTCRVTSRNVLYGIYSEPCLLS